MDSRQKHAGMTDLKEGFLYIFSPGRVSGDFPGLFRRIIIGGVRKSTRLRRGWKHFGNLFQDKTPNTQYPIPNTQYPIPNTQYPIPNTQYPILT